ncbi:MAG: DUF58 domain-containing protein [Chlorobi bacterium]|nr:DUF58 domain-containing protein [Chlorobiota bacterium]
MKNLLAIQQYKEFENLGLIAKHIVEGFITGLHRSPFHGFSVEFAEHRLYNQGESIKHIDWKLYARTEKLFVKRFEEETNVRSQIILDTSSSMLFPYKDKKQLSKLGFSIYAIAALIFLLRKQRDAVGLTLFSDKIDIQTNSRLSFSHSQRLFNELEKLLNIKDNPQKRTSLSTVLHQVSESIHKRSLVIIFSDLMGEESIESLFSALQHLRYNKHEVILFHVADKKHELDFEFQNRPYKFIDLETGGTMRLNPGEIKEEYRKFTRTFNEQLNHKCGQYKIDLVEADINNDFQEVLLPYLIKRSKLY